MSPARFTTILSAHFTACAFSRSPPCSPLCKSVRLLRISIGSIRSAPLMPEITGHTRIAAVIGWPVEHSLSPPMQNAAIQALGLDWIYIALPVHPTHLEAAIHGARAIGMVGVNCTIPHKQAVI